MIRRSITNRVLEGLADTPVVMVNGPRQAGKSTLLTQLAAEHLGAPYVTLDDATVLSAAAYDPAGFLRGFPGAVAIDEAQRAPGLLLAIKAEVDRDRRPGRFLLSGSANALTVPRVSESLAGRMEVHRLWPLSRAEVEGASACFVDLVLAGSPPMVSSELGRRELLELALVGGFPEARARPSARRRRAWFASYLTSVVERDVRDLASISGLSDVPRLLEMLAARSAGLLTRSGLARDMAMSERTLGRYLALLEAVFLVALVPAWARNVGTALTKAPKVYTVDTGLMGQLLRIASAADAERDAGPLLETFVAMELIRQLGWSDSEATLHHYRTAGGREVDLVIEAFDGRLAAVEVKCAATVRAGDFAGIRHLMVATGESFVAGIVLYTGPTPVAFGERLWALPVESLWADAPG